MELWCNNRNITHVTGNLSWTNTAFELATKLSFELPKINAKYTSVYYPKIGEPVGLDMSGLGRVFQGKIIIIDDGDKFVNKYTCVDWGFDLNKESMTIQFNNSPISQAISRVVGGKVDMLKGVTGKIKAEFIDKKKSEILDEIIDLLNERTGKTFNYDVTPKGLRVYRFGDLTAKPKFKLTKNAGSYSSFDLRGDVSHSVSIEDGKKETLSFTVIDDIYNYIRAGEVFKLDGTTQKIISAEHSIKQGWHYVKLGLEK
jgi:hypothetical protein